MEGGNLKGWSVEWIGPFRLEPYCGVAIDQTCSEIIVIDYDYHEKYRLPIDGNCVRKIPALYKYVEYKSGNWHENSNDVDCPRICIVRNIELLLGIHDTDDQMIKEKEKMIEKLSKRLQLPNINMNSRKVDDNEEDGDTDNTSSRSKKRTMHNLNESSAEDSDEDFESSSDDSEDSDEDSESSSDDSESDSDENMKETVALTISITNINQVRGFCVPYSRGFSIIMKQLEKDYGSRPRLFYHDYEGDEIDVIAFNDFDYVVRAHNLMHNGIKNNDTNKSDNDNNNKDKKSTKVTPKLRLTAEFSVMVESNLLLYKQKSYSTLQRKKETSQDSSISKGIEKAFSTNSLNLMPTKAIIEPCEMLWQARKNAKTIISS